MATELDDRAVFDATALWLALWMLLWLAVSVALGRSEPLAAAGPVGLSLVVVRLARQEPPRSWLPSAVTGVRLLLTGALCWVAPKLSPSSIAFGILVVFALDGLDGLLARITDSQSRLGAQLDNESDAFLMAVVCFSAYQTLGLAAWVLTAASLRYGYVLLVALLPSRGLVPASRLATWSHGIAIGGFVLAFLPLGSVSRLSPVLSTLLLLWSFSRSFYWSLRGAR
jgi:phosphatidylglycerophosphate synthase